MRPKWPNPKNSEAIGGIRLQWAPYARPAMGDVRYKRGMPATLVRKVTAAMQVAVATRKADLQFKTDVSSLLSHSPNISALVTTWATGGAHVLCPDSHRFRVSSLPQTLAVSTSTRLAAVVSINLVPLGFVSHLLSRQPGRL